jgi:hypothetical protein
MLKDDVIFDENDESNKEILNKNTFLNFKYFENKIYNDITSSIIANSYFISFNFTGTLICSC